MIATIADVDPLSFEPEDEGGNRSRVCFYDVSSLAEYEFGETVLEKVGDYILEGKSSQTGMHQQGDGKSTSLLPGLAFVTGFRHDPVPPGCILATEVSDCAAESTLIDTRSVRRKISSTSLKLRAFFLSSSGRHFTSTGLTHRRCEQGRTYTPINPVC